MSKFEKLKGWYYHRYNVPMGRSEKTTSVSEQVTDFFWVLRMYIIAALFLVGWALIVVSLDSSSTQGEALLKGSAVILYPMVWIIVHKVLKMLRKVFK